MSRNLFNLVNGPEGGDGDVVVLLLSLPMNPLCIIHFLLWISVNQIIAHFGK